MSGAARPQPRDFDDYRAYLRAMIAFLKDHDGKFSYRYFSRRAGLRSPNFLKLVAEGKRNLSYTSIGRFARALDLTASEAEGFEALVLLAQADSDADRERQTARIRRAQRPARVARLEKAQWEVYSSWYILPIRELMLQPEFREDPVWISARLRPHITPAKARRALEDLERVGLAARDADGRLRPTETKLTTPASLRSRAVREYHRQMLRVAADALDLVPLDRRNVTSLTVSMSRRQYEAVVRRIERFRGELLDLLDDASPSTPGEVRDVYVLGFSAIPLTRLEEP